MKIVYHKFFEKSYWKLDLKIRDKFKEILRIFIDNPFDSKLNNHALLGNYKWYRSINITWDYRAVFQELSNWKYEFVKFIKIWTHSQLY